MSYYVLFKQRTKTHTKKKTIYRIPFKLLALLEHPLELLPLLVAGNSCTSQVPPSSLSTVTSNASLVSGASGGSASAAVSLTLLGGAREIRCVPTGSAASSAMTGKRSLPWKERRKRDLARRCRWYMTLAYMRVPRKVTLESKD